jgi:hypothetical protein
VSVVFASYIAVGGRAHDARQNARIGIEFSWQFDAQNEYGMSASGKFDSQM